MYTPKSFVHFFKNNKPIFFYCLQQMPSCCKICLPIYLKIGVNIKIASVGAKLDNCFVTESCICLLFYLKIGVNIKTASVSAKLHSCLRLLVLLSFNLF